MYLLLVLLYNYSIVHRVDPGPWTLVFTLLVHTPTLDLLCGLSNTLNTSLHLYMHSITYCIYCGSNTRVRLRTVVVPPPTVILFEKDTIKTEDAVEVRGRGPRGSAHRSTKESESAHQAIVEGRSRGPGKGLRQEIGSRGAEEVARGTGRALQNERLVGLF